jgi:hypothetical protein
MDSRMSLLLATVVLLAVPANGASQAQRIEWSDLRPAGQKAEQLVLPAAAPDRRWELSAELDGRTVEITGFLLPADREGNLVYEFMLVPLAGACSHAPQPAPNQVVRVTPRKPFEADGSYQMVTVIGAIEPGFDKAQLFILDGVRVIESGYRIGMADVKKAGGGGGGGRIPGPSPWKFLRN